MTRAIVFALSLGALCVATGAVLGVVDFRDVGYPDSSNLLRVSEFVHSGNLYPAFDRPPYLVTLYGPLTYIFLAGPWLLAHVAGMRLAELGALGACLWLVFAIARRTLRERSLALLSVLFAASSAVFAGWTTQLRGDLPGLACSLLAIYLVVGAEPASRVLAAGACAGLAISFKQTFVAAPLAIVVWLVSQKRPKTAALFVIAAASVPICIYGVEAWREPLMLHHLQALRGAAVLDVGGAAALFFKQLTQPVMPLALLGVFCFLRERSPERRLLLIYGLAAWIVAALSLLQIGGNINYFWEPMLASSVLMAAGLTELERIAKRLPILPIVFAVLFVPTVLHDYYYLRTSVHRAASYTSRKQQWLALTSVLQGKHLLSTYPDVAILGAPPELPDPFFNTLLERNGRWNPQPVLDALRSGGYDVLITSKGEERVPQSYRGIPLWSDAIWGSVKDRYQPVCVIQDRFNSLEAWLPRGSLRLIPEFTNAGCMRTQ